MVRLGRTSKNSLRRIRAALERGLITPDEGARLLKFCEVQRALEVSDLDRRLRKVESVAGTIIPAQRRSRVRARAAMSPRPARTKEPKPELHPVAPPLAQTVEQRLAEVEEQLGLAGSIVIVQDTGGGSLDPVAEN
jgi:hypothetical protein